MPSLSSMDVLVLAALLAVGLLSLSRIPSLKADVARASSAPFWFGIVALVLTWCVLVPLNIWSNSEAGPESWIFGSERFDGGVVETGTIIFYILALVLCGRLMLSAQRLFGPASAVLWRGLLALGALAIVLMVGEETSWGQHWLGFSTPADLKSVNLQGEANMHNLVSPRTYDLIYQVLGWALILAAPFADQLPRSVDRFSILRFLKDLYREPATFGLMATTGILLQHEVFEELAEMILAITLFQAFWGLSRRAACSDHQQL